MSGPVLATCRSCRGTGRHGGQHGSGGACSVCKGTGHVAVLTNRDGDPVPCAFCSGSGTDGGGACTVCDGTGWAGVVKSDGLLGASAAR